MEALSLFSTIEVALKSTSMLVSYIKTTKDATSERKLLCDEALLLSKQLERLQQHSSDTQATNLQWLASHADIVRQFEVAYTDFASALNIDPTTGEAKPQSRLRTARTTAKWSFTKSDVFAILERIGRLQNHASALLADRQHAVIERLGQLQQQSLDQKLKARILNWLTPLQMPQIHQAVSDRVEKGSGAWLVESDHFKRWENGDSKRLWYWGIPGAGKTVLASIIINHIRKSRPEHLKGSTGVAFLYLKYDEPEQTMQNLIASVIRQLVQDMDVLPAALHELYKKHHQYTATQPGPEETLSLFSAILEDLGSVYIIVDALDECSEDIRWDLIEELSRPLDKLHVLLTSRFLDSIAEELQGYEQVEVKANKADIELFVDRQIRKNRNLQKLVARGPNLRDDIKRAVVDTAQNMFLLARLHIESLTSAAALSIKHVRKRLQALPSTLQDTYHEALNRVQNQDEDHKWLAMKALVWVCCAFRSLSLHELQHALVIEPGQRALDREEVIDGNSITALCAGLIVIDHRTNAVNLVHYTCKKFFEDVRNDLFPGYHARITVSCATYLTLESLKEASVWQLVKEWPLSCYAAQHIGEHARLSPEDELDASVLDILFQLLSQLQKRRPLVSLLDGLDLVRSGVTASAAPVNVSNLTTLFETKARLEGQAPPTSLPLDPDKPYNRSLSVTDSSITEGSALTPSTTDSYDDWEEDEDLTSGAARVPEVTALHLAASMGLAKVGSMLLKENPNVDAVDETGKTALNLAMDRGFEKAVEFLLVSGATVDLRYEHGQSVLLMVTERGWRKAGDTIVEVAHSAKEDYECEERRRVDFILAVYRGDIAKINAASDLVSRSDEGGDRGTMALILAVERDDQQSIACLLKAGVKVDSRDNSGQTALHRAVRRGNGDTVRLLLAEGAEVDSKDDDGRTPWSGNLRLLNTVVLDILLRHGADPNTRGLQYTSELYSAGKNGEASVVKYMLDSGTSPSILTKYNWAALHWAAPYGHVECTRLLMEAGADLSPLSDQGVTPLDLAVQANQTVTTEMLMQAGAKRGSDPTLAVARANLKSTERVDEWTYSEEYDPAISRPDEELEPAVDKKGVWKLRHWADDGSRPPHNLLRITPDFGNMKGDEDSRWTNDGGALLSRTGWDDGTPNMCFEPGVDRAMEDVMVACWVAKLWSEFMGL